MKECKMCDFQCARGVHPSFAFGIGASGTLAYSLGKHAL